MLISKLQSSVFAVLAILAVLAFAGWQFVAQAQDPPRLPKSMRAITAKKDTQSYVVDIDFVQPNPARAIAVDPRSVAKESVAKMRLAVEAGQMARGWLGRPVSQVTSDGREILGPRVRTRVIPAKKAGWVHVEAILEEVTLHEKDDQPKIAVDRLGYLKTDLPIQKEFKLPIDANPGTSLKGVQMTRIKVTPLEQLPQASAPPEPKDVPISSAAVLPTTHAAPASSRTPPATPGKAIDVDAKVYRIEIQAMEGKETLAMPRISALEGREWTVQIGEEMAVPKTNPLHWVQVGLRFTGTVSRADNGKVQVQINAQHAKPRTEKKDKELVGTDTQGAHVAYTTKLGETVNFRVGANGPRLIVTVSEMKAEQ